MRFVNDIKKYFDYMVYAAKAELKSEISNSYLDWLWWILEPFCFMLIYVIIFAGVFKATEQYFPIFIFSGNTMWTFFSKCISGSVKIIKDNETTITKVYIPKFILLLSDMLVNGYKMCISFGIVAAMLIFFRVPITWNVILIIPIIMILFLFTFGLGCVVMHAGVFVADLSYIVAILLNMLMFFTGIFYSMDRFPVPFDRILSTANPVAFLMISMRKVLMYSQSPDFKLLLVWFVISVLLCWCGVKTIYKNENNYVKVM